jgi:GNAT superfamily N-acetyltransferase
MDITLVSAGIEDAAMILEGQREAFMPSLERYRDGDMNPANEKLENIQRAIENEYFYKILADGAFAGALFLEREPDRQRLKLHTLYVLPVLQNRGIGGQAIDIAERLHADAAEWSLNTPADLLNNRHLYEKKGYKKRREAKINDALTLVYYTKCGEGAAYYEAETARAVKQDEPIELFKGQSFAVGEEFQGHEGWDGWYFCTAGAKSGWVHGSVIDVQGGRGVAKEDYSAYELSFKKGDKLRGLRNAGGWVWCEDERFERGWAPKCNLRRI